MTKRTGWTIIFLCVALVGGSIVYALYNMVASYTSLVGDYENVRTFIDRESIHAYKNSIDN